jgi:hypothetical protein
MNEAKTKAAPDPKEKRISEMEQKIENLETDMLELMGGQVVDGKVLVDFEALKAVIVDIRSGRAYRLQRRYTAKIVGDLFGLAPEEGMKKVQEWGA